MYIITTSQTQSQVQEKFIKVEPGSRSPFPSSTSLWSSAMNTREATHPTVRGIGHLIRKCLCPSTCVHLATSGMFVYTGVTVDNSHQGGYPTHHDDSHRASAMCMSLAGTHRGFHSNHDLVKPLVNIYIRGMNPLRR